MKTYIVQLESHDDIISARDKIAWSKAQRVLMVWPRRGRVLQREVDMLLIQRYCQHLGAQLALVTRDLEVLTNASDLGIPTFSSIEHAQKFHWRSFRTVRGNKVLSLRGKSQLNPAKDLREVRRQFQPVPARDRGFAPILFAVGVIAFLALILFFLPEASITLSPVEKVQQISLPILARPSIQTANPSGGMPAHSLSVVVEGRDQVNSSGIDQAPDGYASVEVEFTNLGEGLVEIPAGSIVSTIGTAPVRFATTWGLRLESGPGKKQMVWARAVLPGTGGNVDAEQVRALEGATGLKVVVVNPRAASGGSEHSVPAPTLQDAQELREKLVASLEKRAAEELRGKIVPGQVMLDGSLRARAVLDEVQSPALGQPADVLQLTLRVEYEAWYVNEADIQSIAQAALDVNLPKRYQTVPGSFSYQLNMQTPASPVDPLQDGFRGTLSSWQTIRATWSAPSEIYAVTGRDLTDASEILSSRLDLASPPVIEVFPTWWGKLPYLPARIKLVEP